MKQTQKLTSIVTALMAISHNRIEYAKGATFEVDEKDIVFLNLAGCVRDPTADELKAHEERQTLATVTATEPDDTDHAGLQPQPPSDSEPETLQPEPEAVANPYDGWLKKDLNAELDKRGIDHDATATNDTLEALLIENDAVQVKAAE